jgi:hypothetical protein
MSSYYNVGQLRLGGGGSVRRPPPPACSKSWLMFKCLMTTFPRYFHETTHDTYTKIHRANIHKLQKIFHERV